MLRITRIHISETDDIVHNFFSQYTIHKVLERQSYRTVLNPYQVLYMIQNPAPTHKLIFLNHLESFLTQELAHGL